MRLPSPGFTLIEVLIAMLIMGAGALAMLMLQLHALRGGRDNALQGRATMMAQELAELRAAHGDAGGPDPYQFDFSGKPAAAITLDCAAAPCTPDAFARAAVADWTTRLARDFPGAQAVVCRDAGNEAATRWQCNGDAAAPLMLKLAWRRPDRRDDAPAPLLVLPIGY